MPKDIGQALNAVRQRIDIATQKANRCPGAVTLIAVSKTFPPEDIRQAWQAGQQVFGENYVQEFVGKAQALVDLPIEWHFIGPVQSNKTRSVATHAHWVHAIDRFKIAERLSAQRPAHLPDLNCCIQVNVSGEASKHGCVPAELTGLACQISRLPNLALRGLMCIPEATDDKERLVGQFSRMQELLTMLKQQGLALDTLSMGMSADLALAIQHGATLVRVGTAIFGSR